MSTTRIIVERFIDGQGLRVVLHNPKGNVLDVAMMGEINGLLDDVKEHRDLKLVCFTGAGDHFSYGASVHEHLEDQAPAMLRAFHGIFRRLTDLGVVSSSTVRGFCLGGAMELAAFCNRVVAHPSATFGQPEIRLGVIPPVAALVLPFRVGQRHADDIVLSGRSFGAAEAREIGLVDEIADDPARALEQWALREIAPKSASSLRYALRASRWHLNQVLRNELDAIERCYLQELMKTHDASEGLRAFIEKRTPRWQNC